MATQLPLVDLRRSIASDGLSPAQAVALAFIKDRAANGRPVTQMDITLAVGSQNYTGSTSAGILKQLEDKGLITRTFYQRGMQVCVVETGQCTAEPSCRATHWRQRTEDVPTPAPAALKERFQTLATMIENEARKIGSTHQEFLMELVFNGFEVYLEKQGAEA